MNELQAYQKLYGDNHAFVDHYGEKFLEKNNFDEDFVYISCSCYGELALINNDEDFIYLSHYEHGNHKNSKLRWGSRLNFIWRILTTGKPYSDQIVLHPRDAKLLGNTMLQKANIIEKIRRKKYGRV